MEDTSPLHLLYSSKRLDSLPPATQTTIRLCRYLVRPMGWDGRLTWASPLWHGTYLRQVAALQGFCQWDIIGISTLGDIMWGRVLKSFKNLQDEFQLHKSQFFRYLQLRHALSSSLTHLTDLPEFHPLEGHLLTGDLGEHTIRQIYQTLTTHSPTTLHKTRRAWQDDISELTDDDWTKALASPRGAAVATRYRLIQFKYVHGAY